MKKFFFNVLFFTLSFTASSQYVIIQDRIDNVEDIKLEITKQCRGTVFSLNENHAIEMVDLDDYYDLTLVKLSVDNALDNKKSLIIDQVPWFYDRTMKVKHMKFVTYNEKHQFYRVLIIYEEKHNMLMFLTERIQTVAEIERLKGSTITDTLQNDTTNLKVIDK